jgi:hypothetical protein
LKEWIMTPVNFSGVAAELSHGTALPSVTPVDLVQRFARAMSAPQPADFSLQPPEVLMHRVDGLDTLHHSVDPAGVLHAQAPAESYNHMTAVNVIHLRA